MIITILDTILYTLMKEEDDQSPLSLFITVIQKGISFLLWSYFAMPTSLTQSQ